MAIINAGLLISTKKSAGGMNFYKRSGVQCMRNKPQRSANYVSTDAQVRQQTVFGEVAAFIKSAPIYIWLVRNCFTAKKSGKGQTSFNAFSQMLLRAVSRDADGQPRTSEDREAQRTALAADPALFFAQNGKLSSSIYSTVVGTYVPGASGNPGSILFSGLDMAAGRAQVAAANQDYNNSILPDLLVMGYLSTAPALAVPQLITGTAGLLGAVTYELPAGFTTGTVLQYAVAFRPTGGGDPGTLAPLAVMESVTETL